MRRSLKRVQTLARRVRAVTAAVALAALAVLWPLAAGADTQQRVVTQAQVPQLPAGDLIVRFMDLTVPTGQPAVTHMHGAGFTYAVAETHVFTAAGKDTSLAPGQAAWIGAQEPHGHGAAAGASSHFWFVLVGPAATKGTPPTWPYPTAHIAGETASFQVAAPGPYDLILSEVRLERPGDTIAALGQGGPTGVAVLEGQVSLGGQTLTTEGTVLQQPGDSGTFTNSGTGTARLLALQVRAASAAPGLPNTGAGGGAPAPLTWLALAALATLLLAGGLRLRRAAR
jgi:quercetin dioxygenase-like cupin family protein